MLLYIAFTGTIRNSLLHSSIISHFTPAFTEYHWAFPILLSSIHSTGIQQFLLWPSACATTLQHSLLPSSFTSHSLLQFIHYCPSVFTNTLQLPFESAVTTNFSIHYYHSGFFTRYIPFTFTGIIQDPLLYIYPSHSLLPFRILY